jgi:hypothetical protein
MWAARRGKQREARRTACTRGTAANGEPREGQRQLEELLTRLAYVSR